MSVINLSAIVAAEMLGVDVPPGSSVAHLVKRHDGKSRAIVMYGYPAPPPELSQHGKWLGVTLVQWSYLEALREIGIRLGKTMDGLVVPDTLSFMTLTQFLPQDGSWMNIDDMFINKDRHDRKKLAKLIRRVRSEKRETPESIALEIIEDQGYVLRGQLARQMTQRGLAEVQNSYYAAGKVLKKLRSDGVLITKGGRWTLSN